jgi:hypothetical protein
MKGSSYNGSNDSVQFSFQYKSHVNLTVGTTASVSSALETTEVFLSLLVAAHVKIGNNQAATITDMVLPAGVWPLVLKRGQTISLLALSGGNSGQASIIFVEG